LPIGSGEIESGHRYGFQNRLNIAGGVVEDGKPKNMIALRVLRANLGWEDYCSNGIKEAA
jgi:hypothetical protein